LQIRAVGKDDVGAFAARFQPDALHIAVAGVFQQLLAGAGGAGKGDDFNVRMQGQRLPGFVAKPLTTFNTPSGRPASFASPPDAGR
jgi:hypothetical protein